MKRYDFRLGGQIVGSFVLTEKPGWIHQTAAFTLDGQEQVNNYAVRLDHTRPIAVRGPAGEWLDVAPGVYPSAAWPLVLRLGLTEYDCLDEASGTVGHREIRVEDGLHVEYAGGQVVRRFWMADGHATYIHWGDEAESFPL